MAHFKNIIVRMPNWIGDLVMATPVLADLKIHYPSSSITAMALESGATLLENSPYVDQVFAFSKPSEFERKKETRQLISRLQQGKYDLGLLLTNSFSSAWTFWRGRIEKRMGYQSDFRSFLLTSSLPKPKKKIHQVEVYKHLLSLLHIPFSQTLPEIFLTQEELDQAKETLKTLKIDQKKIIGIHPGASFGPAKCWLPPRYRALAESFVKSDDKAVLFFGDSQSSGLINQITEGLSKNTFNLAGKTSLRELAALISQCDLMISNDSGPMHMAAALKVPLLALFGSTNEITTGPYKHGTVIHKHVSCSPCYLRTCPIDFKCMKQITTDEVIHKAHQMLEFTKKKPLKILAPL